MFINTKYYDNYKKVLSFINNNLIKYMKVFEEDDDIYYFEFCKPHKVYICIDSLELNIYCKSLTVTPDKFIITLEDNYNYINVDYRLSISINI